MYVPPNFRCYLRKTATEVIKKRHTLAVSHTFGEEGCVTIWYPATDRGYNTLSHLFAIRPATISNCIWEVCHALRSLQSHYISLPRGNRLWEVVEGFQEMWGFPQCGGVIDGSHIPVTAPSENTKDCYNRKRTHSAILQAVVGHCYWRP